MTRRLSHLLFILFIVSLFVIPIVIVFLPTPSVREVTSSQPAQVTQHLMPPPVTDSTPPAELCSHLYRLTCGSLAGLNDPTGDVEPDAKGEIEALRLYETIIHKHPDWTSEQVDDELVAKIYTDRRRKRLQEVFNWVLTHLVSSIESWPDSVFDADTKAKLVARLKETTLELPPPASVYANEPELFTKNDVYYGTNPQNQRTIRIGGAYLLTVKSRFNRVFTFAHELSHAIDPCELKSVSMELPAYNQLEGCFLKKGIIKSIPPASKCTKDDSMSETFADWMASYITAQAIQEFIPYFTDKKQLYISVMNSVKDLCAQESWLEDEMRSHPSPAIRIGQIFGKNPQILKLLGCGKPTTAFYCSFEGSKPYE